MLTDRQSLLIFLSDSFSFFVSISEMEIEYEKNKFPGSLLDDRLPLADQHLLLVTITTAPLCLKKYDFDVISEYFLCFSIFFFWVNVQDNSPT